MPTFAAFERRRAARARALYQQAGTDAAARLGLPAPQGGTFLFFDVARWLEGGDLGGLLGRCAERGVLLAPGPSFGPYPTHVRLCFSAMPPADTARGVAILAEILGL